MELESLQIQITSDAKTADAAIDSFVNRLTALKTALGGFKAISFGSITKSAISANSSLTMFSSTITNLSQNLKIVNNNISILNKQLSGVRIESSVSTSIDAITASMRKLGGKQISSAISNLPKLATGLQLFNKEINGIGALKFDTASLTSFVTSISRLGGKASTQAVANLPRLTVELKNLMNELSKVPAVSENLVRMTEALSRLARTGRSSGTAATSLANSFSLFGNRVNFTRKSAFSLASAIGKVYATYWALFRGFRLLGDAIDISSSLTEVENVVRQTFGQYESLINNFAKTSIEKFGMSELSAKQFASRFQAMGTALDIPQGQMAKMSIRLTELAGDMASFYDVSQEDIAKSLQSVFSGTTAPMRRYGIDLTQATLKEWALKQGLDANISSMTQAEKAMLRYQYVLAHTTNITGDFARTADTWHNQITMLRENFKALGAVVGSGLINAFKPFIKALNSVLQKVIAFAEMVTNALGSIFGWKYEASDVGITDDLADSYGDVADAANDAANGTKKAAKEAKKSTRAFDELKVISSNKDKGSSGSGSGSSGGGGASGSSGKLVAADTIFKDYESKIKDLEGLGESIRDALVIAVGGIEWDKIYAKASGFGTGLAEFLNGLFSNDKKGNNVFTSTADVIAGALNTALHGLDSFASKFKWKQFGTNLASGCKRFFKKWDAKLTGDTFSKFVNGILSAIVSFVKGLNDSDTWAVIMQKFVDFLEAVDFKKLAINLSDLVSELLRALKKAINAVKDNDVFTSIGQKIADFICNIDWAEINWNFAGLWTSLKDALLDIPVDFASGFIGGIVDNIFGEDAGKKVKDAIDNFYNTPVAKALREFSLESFIDSVPAFKTINDFVNGLKNIKSVSDIFGLFGNVNNQSNSQKGDNKKDDKKRTKKNENDAKLMIGLEIATTPKKLWEKFKKSWGENRKVKFLLFIASKAKELWDNFKEAWGESKTAKFLLKIGSKVKDLWDNFKEAWGESKTAKFFLKIGSKISELWKDFKEAWGEKRTVKFLTKRATRISELWKDFKDSWGDRKAVTIGIGFAKDSLNNLWSSVKGFFGGKTVSVGTKATKKADGGVFSGGSWKPIKKYAVGGLPNMGQMFVAREAGPELVGTLGGHTAVMNNDQIVSSVSYGVAQAVKEVIQPLLKASVGNNRPIQILLDGKVIFDSTRQSAQEYFNRTGMSPFPV